MGLIEKLTSDTEYYRKKKEEVEKAVFELEKRISRDENLLDLVLDEIEDAENIMKELQELKEGENGGN